MCVIQYGVMKNCSAIILTIKKYKNKMKCMCVCVVVVEIVAFFVNLVRINFMTVICTLIFFLLHETYI